MRHPAYGFPDSIINAAEISYYLNIFVLDCP